MASGGMANAIPALLMLNPAALPSDFATRCLWLIPWVIVISALGVFLAVPAKRQMINVEKLPFPTGTAAATTLRALHEKSGEAERQAKGLGIGGGPRAPHPRLRGPPAERRHPGAAPPLTPG